MILTKVHGLQDVMQSHWSVCTQLRVQQGTTDVFQAGQHQILKGLHDHRHHRNRSVVFQSCDLGILWDGDDSGGFKAEINYTAPRICRRSGWRWVTAGQCRLSDREVRPCQSLELPKKEEILRTGWGHWPVTPWVRMQPIVEYFPTTLHT